MQTFRGKVREVRVFLRGGARPRPHGPYLPVPPLGYLCSCPLPTHSPHPHPPPSRIQSRMPIGYTDARPDFFGGGPADSPPSVPPPVSTSTTATPASVPSSPDPPGGSGLLYVGCPGLAASWDFTRRVINYLCHYLPRLILWCPSPPNGSGATSPHTLPGRRSLVAPSLPLSLAVGGLCRSGVPSPVCCIWNRTKGARS